ncbi:aromatic acid exporter family protein [Plantactinospora sp. KBS50]|uniref:FUSC family protein n=1 Tax=Plantactinospora sp. KBS50 TaxID=2024580 RepID=UPI000BAAD007|nr:FUSC family protein [Plantactinospora sp. KBS50]ASW57399.1 hypothetical protein CIK06_03585 [Plantactinospora sp. KBS50]
MGWFRLAAGRLRQGWVPIAEATLAATLAWIVDTRLIGHPQPFFAPAAALIVLGQTRGQRIRRAVEVVLGVAAGVLVADLVIQALGPRGTWTIFTVILLTLGLAVAVGASTVTVVQAAVSALYLVVVTPTTTSLIPFRFVDALIGGGVAVLVSQLITARNPLAPLVAQAREVFGRLAELVEEITEALERHSEPAARAALARARTMDATVDLLQAEVTAAGEALRLPVRRRRRLHRVHAVDASIRQVDYAVRNVRVLARAAVTLTRSPAGVPAELFAALRSLAAAIRAAGEALVADLHLDDARADRCAQEAEEAALTAVRVAGGLFAQGPPLPLIMIIGQVRATAIDLLRGVGNGDDAELLGKVDEAFGLPPV